VPYDVGAFTPLKKGRGTFALFLRLGSLVLFFLFFMFCIGSRKHERDCSFHIPMLGGAVQSLGILFST
jgi:hypothetical protein